MESLSISFIIPALNEAENIGNTIKSIQYFMIKTGLDYEIIVIDNGSQDATVEIVKNLGVQVSVHVGGTIGHLRNIGADKAKGKVLIFLDADVVLTEHWGHQIHFVNDMLCNREKLLTGSHCAPPESNNFLLKYWFQSLACDPRNTHLGTGHMILSKTAFFDIGGFDETLKTGEDYEFCERAKTKKYKIKNIPELKVIHYGFPTTINDFIKREIWHGQGDLISISSMLQSKVVVGTLIFMLLHLFIFLSVINYDICTSVIALSLLGGMLLLSSIMKNRHMNKKTIIYNGGIFYFYYLGRAFAIIRKIFR